MADSKLPPDLADTEAVTPAASDGADWRDGLRLGDRYALRRFLGKGGMGQVWVAWDEVLAKEVALKRVRADVVRAADALDSLRREVLLAQTVTHPNVCRIYDLEPLGGDWVIKMELIRGRTLADLLRETPRLPLAQVLSLGRQLARGLGAVHAVGIVHRDLKPANVLVDDDGRAVLMDFGIARTSVPTGDTEPSKVVGTPEYMAPEQARGQTVDARADLYALGCVLYRMLAGEIPFPAATRVAVMARHLVDAPPDVRAQRPDAPGWLAALVRALMAKTPAQRPPSALAVATRLHEPPSPARRIAAAAASLALLCAVVAGGWVGWRAHVRDSWRPQLQDLPHELDADSTHFYASPDGHTLAFDAYRDGSWRVFTTPVAGGVATPVSPLGQELFGVAPDGKSLLVVDAHMRLSRLALDDGTVAPIGFGVRGAVDCGRFGVVAVEKSPRCDLCQHVVRHRPDGTVDEIFAPEPDVAIRIYLAGDATSGRVAYATIGRGREQLFLVTLDPVGVRAPVELPVGPDAAIPWLFTARDTLVATVAQVGHDGGDLWELTLDGKKRRQLTFGGHDAMPSQGPGGELFYETIEAGSAAFTHDYSSGRDRRLTFGAERIRGLLPTPDGKGLVISTWRGRNELVLVSLDGGAERVVATSSGAATFLSDRFVDGRFYYQVVSDLKGGPLASLALDDAKPRIEIPWLRGTLLWVGGGFVHYDEYPTPTQMRAMRMQLAKPHEVAPDLPRPWDVLLEAPAGGWRLGSREAQPSIALWPPNVPLSSEPVRRLHGVQFVWSADGRFLVYYNGSKIFRHEVATGQERAVLDAPNLVDLAESPDGSALYTVATTRHARRQAIVNFADRPPL
jgi:hypothetical protein